MSSVASGKSVIAVANRVMSWYAARTYTWYTTEQTMIGVDYTHRPSMLKLMHRLVAAGKLEKRGTGKIVWRKPDSKAWDAENPFLREDGTEAASPNAFGPGRLKLVGDTYDHKDTLKVQCGAKWDSDAGCWHIPDSVSEKVRLQGLECYKSGAVKIDWEASGYTMPVEPPVNRITPSAAAPSTNGHANGKPHAEHAGKDHTAEIIALRERVRECENDLTLLSTDIKREEDRSAKLAERLTAAEKALAATPKTIKVEKYDGKTFTLKNVVLPKNFDRILSLAKCRRNILLVGPAGCGKSTTAKLLARTLGLDFYKMGGSEGLTASHLLGKDRPLADKGNGKYEISDFVTGFEKGGVVCLDEMDAFDPNTFLVLNQALDRSGELPLPNRPGKPAKKHKDFVCVGTANTMGRGGNRMYVRNQLDASSLSRFQIGLIEVGYSPAVETAVCPNAELREALWAVRTRMEDAGLRRIIDTRYLEDAYVMVESGGWTVAEAIRQSMAGWSKDEMGKVGY